MTMKRRLLLPVCAALLACGGCVLPIPTTHVAAPSIQGQVIHANTGAPIDLAGVLVEGHKEASVLTARDGRFSTDQITRTKPFWVWWPFGGDEMKEVTVKVARPGYEKVKQKVAWYPKSQFVVSLPQPIALHPKSHEKLAEEASARLGQ